MTNHFLTSLRKLLEKLKKYKILFKLLFFKFFYNFFYCGMESKLWEKHLANVDDSTSKSSANDQNNLNSTRSDPMQIDIIKESIIDEDGEISKWYLAVGCAPGSNILENEDRTVKSDIEYVTNEYKPTTLICLTNIEEMTNIGSADFFNEVCFSFFF